MFRFISLFRFLAIWFGIIAMLSISSASAFASEKLAPVPMLRDKQGRDAETGSAQVFVGMAKECIIYFVDLKFMQEVQT